MREISWRHDVDQLIGEAKSQGKPIFIDFSAAPL